MIFDFFTNKDKRLQRKVEGLKKTLLNKHQQTAERKRVIEVLIGIGNEDAINALLMRFTIGLEQPTVDEEEKRMVCDGVVSLGMTSVKPLKEFILRENNVFWAIKALRAVIGDDETIAFLITSIDTMEAVFDRDRERKIQLVSNLREFKIKQVFEKLLSLLNDEDEEIRVMAVEGLSDFGKEESSDALVDRLLLEDETQRIKTTVLNILIDKKWSIKKNKANVQKAIPPTFWIDDTGVVRRR